MYQSDTACWTIITNFRNVQSLLEALKQRAAEAEESFAQAKRESEARLKRAEEAESKSMETQEALQRLVLQSLFKFVANFYVRTFVLSTCISDIFLV